MGWPPLSAHSRAASGCPTPAAAGENHDSIFVSSSCSGSTITFHSTLFDSLPDPSYILWNFGEPSAGLYNTAAVQAPTFTYTNPGTYYISLFVINGGSVDTIKLYDTLTVTAPMMYNWGPNIYLCQGQDTLLTAPSIPGAKYLWNNNPPAPPDTLDTLRVTVSGVYDVSINGCWVGDSIGVFISDSPKINLGGNHVMCDSSNLNLNASTQNGIYTWRLNGTILPNPLGQLETYYPGGLYTVNVIVPGCGVYNDTADITYSPPLGPPFSLGPDTLLCPNEVDTLTAHLQGATAFKWNTGSTDSTILINQAGTFYVFVTYQNQCQVTDSILVTYMPTVQLDFHDTAICQGGFLILNADFGQGTYQWTANPPQRNDQNGSNQATYYVYSPGTYTVVAQIAQCSYRDSITVTFDDSLRAYLPKDTSACNGSVFSLTVVGNPDTVTWQDGLKSLTHAVPSPGGAYTAIAWNGCGADTLTTVVSFGACACNLELPTAFTPNGDGHNDLFLPLNYCKMSDYLLQIFDRYGVLVFQSEDPAVGWDGHYGKKLAAPGNYVWSVRYTKDGESAPEIKKGNVVLIR